MFTQANLLKAFSLSLSLSILLIGNFALAQNQILNPPTIDTDKSEVRYGDSIIIFGKSRPFAEILITISSSGSEEEYFAKIITNKNGDYSYNFDTILLDKGNGVAKARASVNGLISELSSPIKFKIGDINRDRITGKCLLSGDFNGDCKIDLIDFSILAYWYNRPNPPAKVDLSGDEKVDLSDFSILLKQ